MKISASLALSAFVLTGAALPSAAAQSTLPDICSVVVTEQVVYFVEFEQVALPVLTAADFGLSQLIDPSVTWIRGTNEFLVTSRAGGGTGGLWRLHLEPNGSASLTDLTAQAPVGLVGDFADATYSLGLDTAFILNRQQGWIVALPEPATASGAGLSLWVDSVDPGEGRSLVENGAHWPFGLIVVERNGLIRRHAPGNVEVLHDIGAPWTAVGSNPVTGEWYVASYPEYTVGKIGGGPQSQLVMEFNVSGFCGAIVQSPADMEWDPYARRAVALAETGVAACAFGGLPTGGNHLVRLPLTAGGGPANNVPVLLTFPGASGIVGTAPDFAHVRHDASDVTFTGAGGVSGAGLTPAMLGGGYTSALVLGKNVFLGVQQAPPNAFTYFLAGLLPTTALFQGQPVATLPIVQIALTTDGAGEIVLSAPVPNDPVLLGVLVRAQWWHQDTTTVAVGDWVSSHAGLYTVGLK